MTTVANGNQQSAGTLFIGSETSGFFDIKKIKARVSDLKVNTVTTGSTVELRQKLSVLTVSPDGIDLTPDKYTAGSCKIKSVTKGFFTLQDTSVNERGDLVYKFLVGSTKTTDPNLAAGVQLAPFLGSGEIMPGAGVGQNTFLFLIQ